MAGVNFIVIGNTENKDQLKGAIEEALKNAFGTVVLSTNPAIGAALHVLIEDIVEAGTNPYGDYDEMDDEDQESAPADNPNPTCDEKCVDQGPEEGEGAYEYTPLEYATALTEAQRAFLNKKGFTFLEQLIVLEEDELCKALGEEQYGIMASVRLWSEQHADKDYSAEIK